MFNKMEMAGNGQNISPTTIMIAVAVGMAVYLFGSNGKISVPIKSLGTNVGEKITSNATAFVDGLYEGK